MSATELITAILRDDGTDDAAARAVLTTALQREVDPLRYCATMLGLGERLVAERAAAWAGVEFLPAVPPEFDRVITPDRLEALGQIRTLRLTLPGGPVLLCAPEFTAVLKLRDRRAAVADRRDRVLLVPETALRSYLAQAASQALLEAARQGLSRHWPFATAQLELTAPARLGFILALALLVGLVLAAPYSFQAWLLPVALCLLMGPSVFRLAAVFTPPPRRHPVGRPDDNELPHYSVLIPLRDEAAMVPQLFESMRALDYPPERLDIIFVVEQRSAATLATVTRRLGDPRFLLVPVPDSLPRTKPKALDYALPLCRGEFVVVFDAEDVPDPDQLWRAALRFRDRPEVECLQARLVIGNGRRHWLAALFAGEYAGLFTVMLPALAQWRLPVPLGGTSNHFRTATLRQVGGWDAFNVTEDADIGIRLARLRLRVDVLEAATREAAPVRLGPWLGQRTRWMKGWMQTFIVHNRDPGRLAREMGLPAMLAFELLVLGMITAPLLHVGFVAVVVAKLALGWSPLTLDAGWPALYGGMLLLGYGSALAMMIQGLHRTGRTDLLASQLLLPLYWALIAVATLRAAIDLAHRPFYWFKSPHHPEQASAKPGSPMPGGRRWPAWSK